MGYFACWAGWGKGQYNENEGASRAANNCGFNACASGIDWRWIPFLAGPFAIKSTVVTKPRDEIQWKSSGKNFRFCVLGLPEEPGRFRAHAGQVGPGWLRP